MRPWELHPALVHFPIAFLIGAIVLDVFAWRRVRADLARTATNLMIAGTVAAACAGLAGLLAFFTVPALTKDAQDLMLWHLGLNVTGLLAFTALSYVRWRSRALVPSGVVRAIGIACLGFVLFGAYLGGEIVYKGGAGVDPNLLAPAVREGKNPS